MRSRKKKKSKPEEHVNHERWLVSYADFITLLFAFFIVLYATSEQDKKKMQDFEQSMKKHISSFGGRSIGNKPQVNQAKKGNAPIDQQLKKFSRGKHASERLLGKVEEYVVTQLSQEDLEKHITEMDTDTLGVRLTFAADQVFEPGTEKLQKSALKILNLVARLIKIEHRRVWIESHMDGETGDKKAWQSSSERSMALARYLLKVHKLEPSSVAAVAFGAERPLFPNNSDENRAKNRRFSFLILSQDAPF